MRDFAAEPVLRFALLLLFPRDALDFFEDEEEADFFEVALAPERPAFALPAVRLAVLRLAVLPPRDAVFFLAVPDLEDAERVADFLLPPDEAVRLLPFFEVLLPPPLFDAALFLPEAVLLEELLLEELLLEEDFPAEEPEPLDFLAVDLLDEDAFFFLEAAPDALCLPLDPLLSLREPPDWLLSLREVLPNPPNPPNPEDEPCEPPVEEEPKREPLSESRFEEEDVSLRLVELLEYVHLLSSGIVTS